MKSYFPAKTSIFLRAVLIFGLLNGLLFSSGEGIRLLPFPTSGISGQTNSELKNSEEHPTEKNLHRFHSRPTTYQSKFQRNNENHWLIDENFPGNLLFDQLTQQKTERSSAHQTFSKLHLFTKNIGSRAPPPA
jgi:hypothetical protein